MTALFDADHEFVRIAGVCRVLGVPQDDWVLFWRWADELPSGRAVDELNSYVDVLVADRCRNPADDGLNYLIVRGMTIDEIRDEVSAMVAKPSRQPV